MPLSEKTRREIIRALKNANIRPNGVLAEIEFLERIFDLDKLPTTDYRRTVYDTAEKDIYQHTVNNQDWTDNWIYDYVPFDLLKCPDIQFLRLLCEMINPQVRPNEGESQQLLKYFNDALLPEGYQIVEKASILGSKSFEAIGVLSPTLDALEEMKAKAEKMNAKHLQREIVRMQTSIERDPELLIGTAKEFVETICKSILAEKGIAFKPDEDVPRLVFMAIDATKQTTAPPDAKTDELTRRIVGNLNSLGNCIAELRNLHGTGHGKGIAAPMVDSVQAGLAVNAATTIGLFLFQSNERTKT